MKKISKKERDKIIREHMSELGKSNQKKYPLTSEKARELVNKRWKKGVDKSA